ncbi:MAG TPA: TatD family hydrolase, partial [Candidatus Absconditabacterales bacterium]|nr:TatD family hydrolase [Candidatus Absconditabacterales bacterium]
MFIDSHTHLNSPTLFENRKKHILDFEKIGGQALVNIGADEEYNKNGITISKEYSGDSFIKCTVGLHPYEVVVGNINENNIEQKLNELEKLYLENKDHIVAIGEAGIDTHYEGDINLELQKELFKKQCDLAEKIQAPIIIHSRNDFDSTIEILQNYKKLKICFHCRGYGSEEIEKLKNYNLENYWIGFCGNVTYPKAQNIRDSLKICNLENILIETDAPYLSPQELRGQTNYPQNIQYIYDFIAKELN